MLILDQYPNDEIFIGHDIRVMVVSVKGPRVKIGVTAPEDVPVHRESIYRLIHGYKPTDKKQPFLRASRVTMLTDSMNRTRDELRREHKITRSPAFLAAIKTALTVAESSGKYADGAMKEELRSQAEAMRDFLALVASTDAVSEMKAEVA